MSASNRLALRALLLGLLAPPGCEGPFRFTAPPTTDVASVTITPDSATLVAGETLALTAIVRDATGGVLTDRPVTWSAVAPGVVAVSGTGTVTAVAPGLGIVIAAVASHADTSRIDVVARVLVDASAGGLHGCARANDGRAYCWGFNLYGQTGIGLVSFIEAAPVPVGGSFRPETLAAGAYHSCGVTAERTAYCWGRNDRSQLGRGTDPGDPTLPAPVAGGLRFTAVAAGEEHSCGLAEVGDAWCWGGNGDGQLGDSGTVGHPAPVPVSGGRTFLQISAGAFHTCAVGGGGAVWCWGANAHGELGDSSVDRHRTYPRPVHLTVPVRAVSAGARHACAVTALTILCWGDNRDGQVGAGLPDSIVRVPAPVTGAAATTAVTAGGRHSCALLADSTAVCWGANDRGQVGDGTTTPRPGPVPVAGGLRFRTLSAGRDHTCGVARERVVYCWGAGSEGQLGTGAIADSPFPVPAVPPAPVTTPP